MPKLRYKDKKKEKKEKKEKKHKSREKPYKPPTLYEEESGWVPPRHEQDEWREHLFEVMMQDEGQDPFYSQYNHVQPTPSMTDEEYRQHIVEGMYKRTHAEEIAAEERRKARKEKKRQERQEAKEKLEKEEAEKIRLYNVYNQLEQLKKNEKSREEYIEKWKALEQLKVVTKKDIPWPIVGKEFSMASVKSFLETKDRDELRKRIRKEQTRYHPDKFITKYIQSKFKGSDKEKEKILLQVNEISGWMNALWTELNQ
ncbi:hypothetical protein BD770DRAFT_440730 [Pilaira anomala]|nr:hypothetical protein BD770DRAFT_440730 [Pilaira anomala]